MRLLPGWNVTSVKEPFSPALLTGEVVLMPTGSFFFCATKQEE